MSRQSTRKSGELSWLVSPALLVLAALLFNAIEARSEDHSLTHKPHGGITMPYDPYAGSGCCDGTDCRPTHHLIKGSSLHVHVEGETLVFDLSDSKIKIWSFNPTPQEVQAGEINPAFEEFRKKLEKTWHWCGYRDEKAKKLITRCVLRPPTNM